MIEFADVCAGYGSKTVLRDLRVGFSKGKVTAVIGPNGCGKSTLLKTVIGLAEKKSGNVLVNGKEIERFSSAALAREVAYLPQERRIPDISVKRMVLHGRFPYLKYPRRYGKTDVEKSEEAMRKLEIYDLADKPLSELSGGMRQKVYIATAMTQDTPIILMDEPTAFLDAAHRFKLLELVCTLAQEGKTVVMVLHDITMALRYCDEIVVISEGRMIYKGMPEEFFQSGICKEIFGIGLGRVATECGWQYFYEDK